MQRSSVIATVVAAGGILVAGSVASVAVINAAATNAPEATTVTLVAAEEPVADPVGDPVGEPATESSTAMPTDPSAETVPAELEPVASEALPSIPAVKSPSAAPARESSRDDDSDDRSAPARTAKPSSSAKPSPSTSPKPAAGISADRARSIVLAEGKGVSVVSVSKDSRQGLATWAVRIARSNGEVLTGYVDRASGVVIDWVVNSGPTPAPQPTASHDDDDDDDHGDDHDDSDDDDHDEDYDNDGKDDDD